MSRYYAMRDLEGDIRAYAIDLRDPAFDLSVPAQMLRLEATFGDRLRAETTDEETVLQASAFNLAPIYNIERKKPRSLTGNLSTYVLEEVDLTV